MLSVRNLVKSFPDGPGPEGRAVDGLSLDVEAGHVLTLLGPSGCGKTTTLRCIAGLERPDTGRIEVAGEVLFSSEAGTAVPAHRRGLGMVFQSYGLWPHMTVFDTVAFPLKVGPRSRRPSRARLRERVEATLAVVRLDGLEGRSATELSGGQQQRLALARALVMEPPLLLMDEPLSNLDAGLREDMRLELKRLQRELGLTAVYVTHDQAEALALSTYVGVMRDGRLEQVARPRALYEHPGSRYVAEFLGAGNLLTGAVVRAAGAGVEVSTPQGAVAVAGEGAPGDEVLVAVRPEAVTLREGPAAEGEWSGIVRARAFRGDRMEHVVEVEGVDLKVRGSSQISIPPGTQVALVLDEGACSLIPG